MYLGKDPVYQYCALGCFSEHVVVAEAACIPLPANLKIPMPVAALIGCCVTTGVGAVLNTARVSSGSDVVVYGAGGVGLSAILGARLADAGVVLAVDPVRDRRIKAAEFGADRTLVGNDKDASVVRECTENRGADFVIEATGIPSVQEACLEAVRPGGTLVLAGLAPVGSHTNFPAARITRGEITITGSYYGTSVPKDDFLRYARYYLDGKLPLASMITRRYPLEEVMQAYKDLEQGRLLRGVLVMNG
jgi:S-(hydroxymethyl)glutathione dehydrogenase/alcohol dehydrogenase